MLETLARVAYVSVTLGDKGLTMIAEVYEQPDGRYTWIATDPHGCGRTWSGKDLETMKAALDACQAVVDELTPQDGLECA